MDVMECEKKEETYGVIFLVPISDEESEIIGRRIKGDGD